MVLLAIAQPALKVLHGVFSLCRPLYMQLLFVFPDGDGFYQYAYHVVLWKLRIQRFGGGVVFW